MNWFVISTNTGKHRINLLLQELNIGQPIDPLLYLQLGYKNISAQDKETYYLIRTVTNFKKEAICRASLNYLATALGTTESTQLYRLKNLQKAKLIKLLSDNTYYIFDPPYPDATFLATIIKLIRRKQLNNLIGWYHTCNNPILRISHLIEIKRMIRKGVYHYKLSSILPNINKENEYISLLTTTITTKM